MSKFVWPSNEEVGNWKSFNNEMNELTEYNVYARAHLMVGIINAEEYLEIEKILKQCNALRKNTTVPLNLLKECVEGL